MNNIAIFQDKELKLVNYNNQLWFTLVDITKALGFQKIMQ